MREEFNMRAFSIRLNDSLILFFVSMIVFISFYETFMLDIEMMKWLNLRGALNENK